MGLTEAGSGVPGSSSASGGFRKIILLNQAAGSGKGAWRAALS